VTNVCFRARAPVPQIENPNPPPCPGVPLVLVDLIKADQGNRSGQ
jgi:hypothetical protein